MHIHIVAPPSMLFPSLCMEPGWSDNNNIVPEAACPCRIQVWVDGFLVERADRFHLADRDSPNERYVAQMREGMGCLHSKSGTTKVCRLSQDCSSTCMLARMRTHHSMG